MATASKAKAPAKKPAAKKEAPAKQDDQAKTPEPPAGPVENAAEIKLGTTRAESVPVPKGVKDVEEFRIEIVDNAHAVVTLNGTSYRLGQSDVSDFRKALDAAFIQLH